MMILSEATHEEAIMPDGAVRAIITEGELTNELLEYPDGRMYLDGSEVIFTFGFRDHG